MNLRVTPIPCHWRLEAVTSWTWEPLLALQAAPCSTTTDFDQCEHGQLSHAPTRLYGLRMAGLHCRLVSTPGKGACSRGRGAHVSPLGRADDPQASRPAREGLPPCLVKLPRRRHPPSLLDAEAPDAPSPDPCVGGG